MRRVLVLIFAVLVLVMPAFAQTDDLPSVYDLLVEDGDFSQFVAALENYAPDLILLLDDINLQWTIFAPTDEALANIIGRFETADEALFEEPDSMSSLVRYHIVPTRVTWDILRLYENNPLTIGTMFINHSISSLKLSSAENAAEGIFDINDTRTNLIFSHETFNGLIYTVDQAFMPTVYQEDEGFDYPDSIREALVPADFDPASPRLPDLLTALEQEGDFNYLIEYLNARPALLTRLNTGLFTLFAAPDSAWEATLIDIYGADIQDLIDNPRTAETFNILDSMIEYSILTGLYEPEIFEQQSFDYRYFTPSTLTGGLDIVREDGNANRFSIYAQVAFVADPIRARYVLIYITDDMIEVG